MVHYRYQRVTDLICCFYLNSSADPVRLAHAQTHTHIDSLNKGGKKHLFKLMPYAQTTIFSLVGMFPEMNYYFAVGIVSCSLTKRSWYSDVQTSVPSISGRALYLRATETLIP